MAVTSAGAAKRNSITRLVGEARFHEDAWLSRRANATALAPVDEDAEDVDTDEVVLTP